MSTSRIYNDIGTASADTGLVMLDGPDGIAITLTPDAAEGTGQALIRAAEEARAQIADPKDGGISTSK
nr:hypothetical protein [Sphingobium sp. AP50]